MVYAVARAPSSGSRRRSGGASAGAGRRRRRQAVSRAHAPAAPLSARDARGERLLQPGLPRHPVRLLPRRARRPGHNLPGPDHLHLPVARHRRARDDPRHRSTASAPHFMEPTNPTSPRSTRRSRTRGAAPALHLPGRPPRDDPPDGRTHPRDRTPGRFRADRRRRPRIRAEIARVATRSIELAAAVRGGAREPCGAALGAGHATGSGRPRAGRGGPRPAARSLWRPCSTRSSPSTCAGPPTSCGIARDGGSDLALGRHRPPSSPTGWPARRPTRPTRVSSIVRPGARLLPAGRPRLWRLPAGGRHRRLRALAGRSAPGSGRPSSTASADGGIYPMPRPLDVRGGPSSGSADADEPSESECLGFDRP